MFSSRHPRLAPGHDDTGTTMLTLHIPEGPHASFFVAVLGASLLLLLVSLLFAGKPRRQRVPRFEPDLEVFQTNCRVYDGPSVFEAQAVARSFGVERRSAVRRAGNPVPVRVNATGQSPAAGGRTEAAFVLDRSTGGLCLALDRQLSPGQVVHVRAECAPDTTPWVPVEVRNCRKEKGRYEVGCQFAAPLPWAVLLLFG
jgi:hypothetical protein